MTFGFSGDWLASFALGVNSFDKDLDFFTHPSVLGIVALLLDV
jgi:hypothetical protein